VKGRAFHQAGHVVAARNLGLRVAWVTIEEGVDLREATKTTRMKEYFDEDALLFGRLKRKGKEKLDPEDVSLFYAILIQRLAGYIAVELAELDLSAEGAAHFEEDRALAVNILNHLEPERAKERYQQLRRRAEKILRVCWQEVEALADRLIWEKTIYFNP